MRYVHNAKAIRRDEYAIGYKGERLILFGLPAHVSAGQKKRTEALIGEAGREAVLPLDRNTQWAEIVANLLVEKLGFVGGGGGQPIIVKIGERTIVDTVIEGINGRSALGGLNTITV